MQAVPAPKASYMRFSFAALTRSQILNSLIDTLNSFKSLMSLRRLILVTPGRIVPSNGGVTSSSSPFSFFQNTKKFMVPTSVTQSWISHKAQSQPNCSAPFLCVLIVGPQFPPIFLLPNPFGHALIILLSQKSFNGTNPLGQ